MNVMLLSVCVFAACNLAAKTEGFVTDRSVMSAKSRETWNDVEWGDRPADVEMTVRREAGSPFAFVEVAPKAAATNAMPRRRRRAGRSARRGASSRLPSVCGGPALVAPVLMAIGEPQGCT